MKSKRSPSFSRLRVAVIIVAAVAFGLVAYVSRADEAPAPLPLKLVIANSAPAPTEDNPHPNGFTTRLLASNESDELAEGAFSNRTNGPCQRTYSLHPNGGAEVIADIGAYFCDEQPYELIDAPTNIEVLSLISFRHGESVSSFSVGPIGAVVQGKVSRVGPLVNDDVEASFITTFPKTWTPMKVTLYDGKDPDRVVAVELFASEPIACAVDAPAGCEPLRVSQYQIQTKGVFFAEVEIGWGLVGNFNPVYGFASSGAVNNGNFRSYPFGKE